MAIPSRIRHTLSGLPSGRLTKWFVIAAWLALGLLVGPLARQLPGVERNDASALGPGPAESTLVRDLLAKATRRQQLPAGAVYVRTGGLTAADRAKVAQDRRALAGLVPGRQVRGACRSGRRRGHAAERAARRDGRERRVRRHQTGPPGGRRRCPRGTRGEGHRARGIRGGRRRRLPRRRPEAAAHDGRRGGRPAGAHLPKPGPLAGAPPDRGAGGWDRPGCRLPAGRERGAWP
jgi:hypothetical protein